LLGKVRIPPSFPLHSPLLLSLSPLYHHLCPTCFLLLGDHVRAVPAESGSCLLCSRQGVPLPRL
jgi:hypothetical protein